MFDKAKEDRYWVKVGHFEVVVIAADDEEAITKARHQLAEDLPRFYDVIRTLDHTRFEVRPAA